MAGPTRPEILHVPSPRPRHHPPHRRGRQALGPLLLPAGKAAWREIARRRQGLEFANLQLSFEGHTLAIASRLRPDGAIVIEIGLGDPRQAARVITAAQLRRAEAQADERRPSFNRRAAA